MSTIKNFNDWVEPGENTGQPAVLKEEVNESYGKIGTPLAMFSDEDQVIADLLQILNRGDLKDFQWKRIADLAAAVLETK